MALVTKECKMITQTLRAFMLALLLLLPTMSGCGLFTLTATSIEASGNKANLQKLETGMSMPQVRGIMGEQNKSEAFSTAAGIKVLVWFYLTEGRAPFRSVDDHNYTPIVFENETLTGWGHVYFDKIRKQ